MRTYFALESVNNWDPALPDLYQYQSASCRLFLLLIDVDVGAAPMPTHQRVYTVFLIPRRFFENNGILYYSYMEENLFST